MSKIDSLKNSIDPIASKIQQSPFVKTITAGMMVSMPAIMAGSFATILKSIQIPLFQEFLLNSGLGKILDLIVLVTINFFALYVVIGIAYHYSKTKKQDGAMAGMIALTSFLAVTPFDQQVNDYGMTSYSLPTNWLGAQGLFAAMIVGFVVAMLYVYISEKGWTIKLPDSVPPVISSSFKSIIPGVLIVSLFASISFAFSLTAFGSFHQTVYTLLQIPLQGIGTNIWAILLITFIAQVLWVIGIHGPMVVIPLAAVAWNPADLANLSAFNQGQDLPNITGLSFYMVYTFAGWGIGLAISMLRAKSERYRTLGKLAVIPSIFGITEPLIFGTPIIMNIKLLIPHVFYPMVSLGLAYFLTAIGILPRLIGVSLPNGMPVLIQGFIQGGWKVALFQLVLIIGSVICYYPFFKSLDNDAVKEEQAELETTQTELETA